MRVLVCGGRRFNNRELLFLHLDKLHYPDNKISCVIDGGAQGADTLASTWAKLHGVKNERFNANWLRYGNSAGAIRNQQMIEEGRPDMVIAFAGGSGTADMMKRAKAAGVRVEKVL